MKTIKLPEKFQEQLKTVPEDGMGYHIVDVMINFNGVVKLYTNKPVKNCTLLILNKDEEHIRPEHITSISIEGKSL